MADGQQQPIDLSAGMVPAASPQKGIDLSAGMVDTPPPDSSFVGDVAGGFKTALNQTGETAMRVLGAVPIVGSALKSTPGWQQSQQQTHEIANAPLDTGGKMVGAGLENILEFVAGDEALKGLSTAAKIQELGRVEQALKKSPFLARMLGNAVRAQAVGTAQAAAHGASGGEAVASGAATALGGAAMEGMMAGGSRILRAIRPTTTEALGETLPVLASQKAGASPLAESVADIRGEQGIAAQQQQAAARGIRNRAQQVAASELDRLNAARRLRWEEGEGVMNLAPENQIPPSRQLATGRPQLPEATAGTAPQLEAGEQPAGLARTHELGAYEGEFPEQPAAAARPGGTATAEAPQPRGQRVRYMEERPPNFEPVDVENETQNIRSFGDAAEKIREHAAPVFDRFDKVTNGEYTRLRGERDAAYRAGDYNGVTKAESAIDDLFSNTRGKIDRLDYQTAKRAWRTSKVLDAVHDAVSKSFNIGEESLAEDAGVWRGINGGSLMRGVNRLTRDYGRTALEDVIGKDGLTGLVKIADLTQTPQRAALYGQKVGDVANTLAGVPGAGGTPATVNWVRKLLLHQMAVNPRVARAVEFAVDNKVTPKVYGPIIAGMIGAVRTKDEEGAH